MVSMRPVFGWALILGALFTMAYSSPAGNPVPLVRYMSGVWSAPATGQHSQQDQARGSQFKKSLGGISVSRYGKRAGVGLDVMTDAELAGVPAPSSSWSSEPPSSNNKRGSGYFVMPEFEYLELPIDSLDESAFKSDPVRSRIEQIVAEHRRQRPALKG